MRFREGADRRPQVLLGVGRAHLGADPGQALGDDREEEADHVDALLEHPGGEALGERGVAEHDRHDRVGAGLDGKPGVGEALAEEARVRVEAQAQFRAPGDEVQGGDRRRGDHRGERVREQVRPRALAQEVDDLLPSAHVAPGRAAEGLAEGAGQDVDPVHDAEVLGRAAAPGAHEADGMAVVDHDERPVALGQIADLAQRRDEAVHREDPVGHDELEARPRGRGLGEPCVEVRHVAVPVPKAPRLAQADPVDDRGVVQLVADHGVLLAEEGLEDAAVCVEAGRVEDRVGGAEEGAQARLELLVDLERAADEADGGHAVAPALERGVRGGDHLGMVREPEVVVGAEIEHAPPAREGDRGALGSRDHALGL